MFGFVEESKILCFFSQQQHKLFSLALAPVEVLTVLLINTL